LLCVRAVEKCPWKNDHPSPPLHIQLCTTMYVYTTRCRLSIVWPIVVSNFYVHIVCVTTVVVTPPSPHCHTSRSLIAPQQLTGSPATISTTGHLPLGPSSFSSSSRPPPTPSSLSPLYYGKGGHRSSSLRRRQCREGREEGTVQAMPALQRGKAFLLGYIYHHSSTAPHHRASRCSGPTSHPPSSVLPFPVRPTC
jgi:hypothetical protein